MSDMTQRLRTNHIVKFRSFLVYILYGFKKTVMTNAVQGTRFCTDGFQQPRHTRFWNS